MPLPEPLAVWIGMLEQGVGRDVRVILAFAVAVRDNCYLEGGNEVSGFPQPIRLQALIESAEYQQG